MLDTSLTPSALKKISKSVMDLSNMSEMQEISKSTSNLMTGSLFSKSVYKKRFKSVAANSKTSLLRSSTDSLSTIDVRRDSLAGIRVWTLFGLFLSKFAGFGVRIYFKHFLECPIWLATFILFLFNVNVIASNAYIHPVYVRI